MNAIRHIVIVGGGTAGWLTAGLLAARHENQGDRGIRITLIESPDVQTIGVGEGTWPTIRKTLARIGIRENDFLKQCDASFKQGSRFEQWMTGQGGEIYHHPFDLPVSQNGGDALHAWKNFAAEKTFCEAMCIQGASQLEGLAPKQRSMPDYVGAMNYAYHLDAVKLAGLLKEHVTQKLGVTYIKDHITDIIGPRDGDIEAVQCRESGRIDGDFFVDCTGLSSLLLGQHYGTSFFRRDDILFNDRAVVTQVPVGEDSIIASETISTAHEAGWIWDIGLPTRRGVGCVYASRYISDDRAEEILTSYVGSNAPMKSRVLKFQSGHREKFWHHNCLAIGLSAGFLEPLEASAIVLIELSAEMLSENLPVTKGQMAVEARKFNDLFRYRWDRIIDFLKLHYVLSKRTEPYWRDNRDPSTIPERLNELLEAWKHRPPGPHDFEHVIEVFPLASYLFVAYGMQMEPKAHPTLRPRSQDVIHKQMQNVTQKQKAFAAGLPTNRAFLSALTP